MPKSLYPTEKKTNKQLLLNWVDNHSAFFIILCFVALTFLFAILINIIYGMCMCEHVVNVKWA